VKYSRCIPRLAIVSRVIANSITARAYQAARGTCSKAMANCPSAKPEMRPLMERFGATENKGRIANPLRNMVGTRRLELLSSTVSVIDSKGVNNRRNRQNRNARRNLLPNCYQNMASGFGAESWGIGPFIFVLNDLIFAYAVKANSLRV
jgi:hypothetical protein